MDNSSERENDNENPKSFEQELEDEIAQFEQDSSGGVNALADIIKKKMQEGWQGLGVTMPALMIVHRLGQFRENVLAKISYEQYQQDPDAADSKIEQIAAEERLPGELNISSAACIGVITDIFTADLPERPAEESGEPEDAAFFGWFADMAENHSMEFNTPATDQIIGFINQFRMGRWPGTVDSHGHTMSPEQLIERIENLRREALAMAPEEFLESTDPHKPRPEAKAKIDSLAAKQRITRNSHIRDAVVNAIMMDQNRRAIIALIKRNK